MIEPDYAENLQLERIPLAGRVLIFGSGQLIHERLFFDFSSVDEVVTYDPYVKPAEPLKVPKSTHATDFSQLPTEAITFDTILCLFSLHFEPRWLFTLAELFQKLIVGGRFVLAEDRGVRAIFDNASVDAGTVDQNVRAENSQLYDFVKSIYAERESRDWAAPWFPDICASDYSLMMQVLSVVSTKAREGDERVYRLRRTLNRDEPSCYLPWKSCFTNDGAFLNRFESMPRPEKVTEIVKLTWFEKLRDFPDLCDLDDYLSRAIWNLVSLRAERNVSRILVSLSPSWGMDRRATEEHFSRSFLQTAYLNIFRHFEAVNCSEVTLGLLNWDLFSPDRSSAEMVETLLPANFSSGRELYLKFERSDWYNDYIQRVGNLSLPWLGKVLSGRHRPGLYLWHPDRANIQRKEMLRVRVPELQVVEEGTDLYPEYQQRDPPPHIYLLEPLGQLERNVAEEPARYALAGAGIVYFLPGNYSPDSNCLLYVLRSLMPAVVGRSAFIETLLHRKLSDEAEQLRKFRDAFHLIQQPLRGISDALSTMQSDTQELRALMFEPEESLFASFALIEPFFTEGRPIEMQIEREEAICIRHIPKDYPEADLRIVIACVLCAIYGQIEPLKKERHSELLLQQAAEILAKVSVRPSMREMTANLKWLVGFVTHTGEPDPARELSILFTDPEQRKDAETALTRIKNALFAPFKIDSPNWHPIAFQLLARHPKIGSDRLDGELSKDQNLSVLRSPIGYAGVLAFARDIAVTLTNNTRKITTLKWSKIDSGAECETEFSGCIAAIAQSNCINVEHLRETLHVVSASPKEWRILHSNYGDLTRPFVSFVNKLLGLKQPCSSTGDGLGSSNSASEENRFGRWTIVPCTGSEVFAAQEEYADDQNKIRFSIQCADKSVVLAWKAAAR